MAASIDIGVRQHQCTESGGMPQGRTTSADAIQVAQSPLERSNSGTDPPPPTEGPVPAVPILYDDSFIVPVLCKRNVCLCLWNVAAVVFSLLTVWFFVLVEDVLPTPSPPPTQAPTTCPFDVVTCNRQCAQMHAWCMGSNKQLHAKRQGKCDGLHGGETLRKEHIGDGRCDRSGCGRQLCECNFDGGDCAHVNNSADYAWVPVLMLISIIIYLLSVNSALVNVIGYRLKLPKLRDEGELTAYVEKMQRAQPQVSFSVVCSHTEAVNVGASRPGGPQTKTSKTFKTHRSSHPFTYATSCTDKSKLTKNWQQPTGGGNGEDGSLGTGFLAVVSSELSWSATEGVTADMLNAEKERLIQENSRLDSKCSVKVEVSLPGWLSTQLYAPADAKFTKRLSCVAELLLVFFGLGAPLYFYYVRSLSRFIRLTVHKTIYIEDHAAPVGDEVEVVGADGEPTKPAAEGGIGDGAAGETGGGATCGFGGSSSYGKALLDTE